MLEVKINNMQFQDDQLIEDRIVEKFSKLAANDETLSGDYLHAYQFSSGFLNGAAFEGNPTCKSALNGIAFYSLSLFQYTRAKSFLMAPKIMVATQKTTEQVNLF